MNTMEMEADVLDMSAILMQAYEVGDLINISAEVEQYLYWKNEVENSPEVQAQVRAFARKKELFEECERFGHFHPEYHAAKEAVEKMQLEMEQIEAIRNFKQAEESLDDLLYSISEMIAHSVSDSIKVPSNKLLTASSGCGSGNCSKCG